ncbi:FecR family protein [Arcticibacter svalbardensis]|nr:FecR family protein [Arcticibacter svalbardensis]
MEKEDIQALLKKYAEGKCNEAEKAWLETWYIQDDQDYSGELTEEEIGIDLNEVFCSLPKHTVEKRRIWPYISAAIFILIGIGTLFVFINSPKKLPLALQLREERFKNDVQPINRQAILTLSNGSELILDSTHTGFLANQAGTKIYKNNAGELFYERAKNSENAKVIYNMLTVPKGGGIYRLILSDGSKVSLNAGSSLTYPVEFQGKLRKVKLQGEAYFIITHIRDQKYVIQTARGEIEDLGTEFNVMDYENEAAMKVTLIKGSVKIRTSKNSRIVIQGQQAEIMDSGQPINVSSSANSGSSNLAWKNGEFQFDDEELSHILRQLERWYDIKVDYVNVPDIHFKGQISRKYTLSHVLGLLEKTGDVKFTINGKNVSVTDK